MAAQHNASMELIPGMDKLLNHMKEQDKKIKELQDENKILINYQTSIAEIEKWSDGELEDIVDVLPQLKKLKAENKKLKEWSLSTQMIEDTSAETIEEFERDVRDNWKENTEFTDEIDELNKTITRLQKERNYLGDYEGGATSEEEEEEDEYPETMITIDKDKFMTVYTNGESYRIYEKDEDVAVRQGDHPVRGRLIFNGEGDPDSVKFIIDSDYEMKEGENTVHYWEE